MSYAIKIFTDVIGIIRDREVVLEKLTNKHDQQQEQAKFIITDGRLIKSITFILAQSVIHFNLLTIL